MKKISITRCIMLILATIIVFLLWTYIIMLGLSFGAVFNVRLSEKLKISDKSVRSIGRKRGLIAE